jgi:hypothetical protein
MGIPTPEPGLVLNYAYLWHDEHRAGLEEGRKDRPSVIVLGITRESDDATIVTMPRSWIVIAEGNEFMWPGYDLRKVPRTDSYEFGFLPPRLFNQVRDAFVAFHKAGQTKTTSRA